MNCDTLTQDSCNCNFIKESVAKIDKLQKEVVSDTTGRCIACEASLFTSANNTIPVRFYTKCGNPVIGNIGLPPTETVYFRIESLRCGRFATLRLLETTTVGDETTLTGTDYTIILDLDSVGSMQCFSPISVEVCAQSTTTA